MAEAVAKVAGESDSFVYNESCPACQKRFETHDRMLPKLYNSLVSWERGRRYHSECQSGSGGERQTEGELFIPDGMVHEGNLEQVVRLSISYLVSF